MSMHHQDWINLAIAIGTCAAAVFSYKAASSASESVETSRKHFEKQIRLDNDKWLVGILESFANSCNSLVDDEGLLDSGNDSLSRMVTVCINAIDFIDRNSHPDSKLSHLKNYWSFLHSSIWIELKNRNILDKNILMMQEADVPEDAIIFMETLNNQYDYVSDKMKDAM